MILLYKKDLCYSSEATSPLSHKYPKGTVGLGASPLTLSIEDSDFQNLNYIRSMVVNFGVVCHFGGRYKFSITSGSPICRCNENRPQGLLQVIVRIRCFQSHLQLKSVYPYTALYGPQLGTLWVLYIRHLALNK